MGRRERKGRSYAKRVADVNAIYDRYAKTGLSNREIWKRYVYPLYGVSERTFYGLLKASADPRIADRRSLLQEGFLFPELQGSADEVRDLDYFRKKL